MCGQENTFFLLIDLYISNVITENISLEKFKPDISFNTSCE